MKKFIRILFVFIIIGAIPLIVSIVIISFKLDSNSATFDFFYRRFTSEKQVSLIIGTSRAAQGIQPQIINKSLSSQFDLPIYNYSFTVNISPFGEAYFNSIKKKVKETTTKNGLFIIAVDPWSLSDIKEMGDGIEQREDNECIAKMMFVNTRPNIEYLIRYFKKDWLYEETGGILNEDGWLQIDAIIDSVVLKENIRNKVQIYSKYQPTKSDSRLNYLSQTIEYLDELGTVVLVRIPISKEMFELEEAYWKFFDLDMINLLKNKTIHYYSFMEQNNRFKTIDGNHLYKDDGARFTKELCDSISKRLK